MLKFKIGYVVICVDDIEAEHLSLYKEYVVIDCDIYSIAVVNDHGDVSRYRLDRFESSL